MSMHSDWLPHEVPPVRAGVYQRDYSGYGRELEYCWFDGTHWYAGCYTVAVAITEGVRSQVPAPWRGLTLEEFTQRHIDWQRAMLRARLDATP